MGIDTIDAIMLRGVLCGLSQETINEIIKEYEEKK